MKPFENSIVVAGAGVSGIRAAFDLAETGCRVLLIDKAPGHGGILPQLDHQFPDNHCGMCRMLPMVERDMGRQFCLKKDLIHENITLMPSCEIVDVKGTPGDLEVSLTRKATGIDPEKCINCGRCQAVCPEYTTDAFNGHLSKRKAVYFPVPFQIPNNRTIDPDTCTRCGECEKVCEVDAIDLSFSDTDMVLKSIQTVLLAFGSRIYDPSQTDLYGFGILKDVVTATGFERLISQSGPTGRDILRPSNKQPVNQIAWVQCVGSRNLMTGSDYCSSACCMFSVKEAILAREKIGETVHAQIFYMDMRTHGRDFQRYLDQAKKDHNIQLTRCRVHSIEKDVQTGDPKITFVDDTGQQQEKIFDLIVLATGRQPDKKLPEFAALKGVHVINTDTEFKDISETVIDADSTAAGRVKSAGQVQPKQIPLSNESPEFLAAICQCRSDTHCFIPSETFIDKINDLPGRITAVQIDAACTDKGFDALTREIQSRNTNRLILLSCSSDLFKANAAVLEAKTGISRYHMDFPEFGTLDEAGLLAAVISSQGILKSRTAWQFSEKEVVKHCIIAGSGPAGLAAANALSRHHIPVTLIEKKDTCGGNLDNIKGEPEHTRVKELFTKVMADANITVKTESTLTDYQGTAGRFSVGVKQPGTLDVMPAGSIILATGGQKKETSSFGFDNRLVITLFDLEQQLNTLDFDQKKLVMIQCVDSREEPDNYCSRICCIKALRTAIAIKEKAPDADITVLYRDIMTYGEYEKIYTQARKNGIRFIPFDKEDKPAVKHFKNHTRVTVFDPVLQEKVTIKADLVSLSTGIRPGENKTLKTLFDLNVTRDGFIKEADYKWRPVDTGKEGIFVCGLSRRPVNAREAMKEGNAAALRALRILNRETLTSQMTTAMVRHTICSRCELCIPACPYKARYIDPESQKIQVDNAACQACGTCASVCPNNAVVISGFEDKGIMHQIESLMI